MSDKKHDVNAVTTEPNVEDQDYIYTPVPQNKRYGWIKMFFVWLCWNVVVGDLATGTALGSSMKFRDALIALSIGDIILVAVMIMTVYIGSKTGLAAMSLESRPARAGDPSDRCPVLRAYRRPSWSRHRDRKSVV